VFPETRLPRATLSRARSRLVGCPELVGAGFRIGSRVSQGWLPWGAGRRTFPV
jgi:hypothetical protein